MNENKTVDKNEKMEIDIQRLIGAVWSRAWIVVLVSVLCAVITFLGTFYFVTPMYKSSAMFYVNNSNLSIGDTQVTLSSANLTASRNLVDSYIVILKTRTSLNEIIDYAGVDRSYGELRGMISAASVNSTEIFEVVVTSPDPVEAERIANAVAYILPNRIKNIIEGTSAKVVDNAIVASSPSSPSYTKNTLIGFLVGLVLSVGAIVLMEIFDITIRSEEDIEQVCKHPILAAVPDMSAPSKGGYYYAYDGSNKRKRKKKHATSRPSEPSLIGKNISFAASEAYKLLRTKLQFSFADENDCHVIGVSSALSGEGKSLSSVNLAYTLSQLDKKVLLIDCDMRRPSINDKLPVQKSPGLSGYLSNQVHLDTLIQKCGIEGEENAFDVISAGQNPPNPIELLSSARMIRLLTRLREAYDYIILDFPPVGEVSDAMAVAKLTDGMLVVVRQHYCNRIVLAEALRQFDFVGSKMLGVVYNCATESGGSYSKGYYKRYYRRYYKRYSKYSRYGYGYGYEHAAKKVAKQEAEKTEKTDNRK